MRRDFWGIEKNMNSRSLIVTVIVCATALMIASLVANAGPLTPPVGPVAPTNKTLAEVEPRIAINATNTPGGLNSLFRIAAPGSYYLTGNIAGVAAMSGIEIASSGVTLDLMGFELLGVVGSLDGVNVSIGTVNIHIHNGSVRNWGSDGVAADFASNSSLRNLRAEGNGASGLRLGEGGLVEACAARSNGLFGISANSGSTVNGNTARNNGGDGINTFDGCTVSGNTASGNSSNGISTGASSTVSGNTASGNGNSGISASTGSTVSGNTVQVNTGDGIFANSSSTVSSNTASFNTGDGIQVTIDCLVLNNNCDSNGLGASDGAGILATGSDNRIDGNNVTDNDRGIEVNVAGNLIIRNSASGNTFAYTITGLQTLGPFIFPGTITSTNPWANFVY